MTVYAHKSKRLCFGVLLLSTGRRGHINMSMVTDTVGGTSAACYPQAQEGFDSDAADSGVIDKEDTVAATTQTAAAAGGLSLALGGDATLLPPPTSPSKAPHAAAPAPRSPAKAAAPAAAPAAAAPAAVAAAKAPEIDLLGGDFLADVPAAIPVAVPYSNGELQQNPELMTSELVHSVARAACNY